MTSDFRWTRTNLAAVSAVAPPLGDRDNHAHVYLLQVQGSFHEAMPRDPNHVDNWIVEQIPADGSAPAGTESVCFCAGATELGRLGTVHHFQLVTP
ncbi:MAG: hypothetical protein GC157_02680 [Frankiales bacterium]|nr:hypothetical protein [Frankiales bacterium]